MVRPSKTRASSPSGGVRLAAGSYTGNGAATQAVAGIGFRPRYLIIYCRSFPGAQCIGRKITQDALNSLAWWTGGAQWVYTTDHIISLDADGFTVGDGSVGPGAANRFNVNLQDYTFIAWG